jgi:hypothetical protein
VEQRVRAPENEATGPISVMTPDGGLTGICVPVDHAATRQRRLVQLIPSIMRGMRECGLQFLVVNFLFLLLLKKRFFEAGLFADAPAGESVHSI